MKQETISKILDILVTEQKEASWTDPKSATDAQALGIMLSKHFEWDGEQIFEMAHAAFEDSNFHTVCEKLNNKVFPLVFNATDEGEDT